ncbi:MAG TPA: hypothetical protein VGJ01_17395 [Pseudolabrys sp.]|jgi:hypothetical protein
MPFAGHVLALDLATKTGWAYGSPGAVPKSGSLRFAREGATMAAHLVGCRKWLVDFIAVNETRLVVFEAPLTPDLMRGRTNISTIRLLIGLAAIVEECLYGRGIDVREARVSDVRAHFLGSNRFKRDEAKRATKELCARIGWPAVDDNAADALALWSYQVSFIAPDLALRVSPLWGRAS